MHIKLKRKERKASPKDLSAQVETIQLKDSMGAFFDVEDQEVLTYVDDLLRSCKQIGPLEPFSLMSKEDAIQALSMLEQKQRIIARHLKNARALKTLLESQHPNEGQPQ